ncbi:MAG: AgmX/PglI C-terminal domain-containing protein [Deltaproteobacteria bacterium]|nr:AgmX/PglI C-terminal domain-containing protein [Deltaproteobacteria bacterium]
MPARVFAMLSGTTDGASGTYGQNIEGGLLGNEAGEMVGGFGFGRSGFGPGGGGTGWGTIGTGSYGTIGHGSGTGSGYGVGGGRGGMHGRGARLPTTTIGKASSTGDLDKAIIRRYIKRNLNKINYCYEKELLANPSLRGVILAEFRIGANGLVVSSRAKGVDESVGWCVATVLSGIEFPKPKDGGEVAVSYPFTFDPGGASSGGAPGVGADRWVDASAPLQPPTPPVPPAWTPFGNVYAGVVASKEATITAVQSAVSVQLGAIAACFPGAGGPTGSVRILLHVDAEGAIAPIYTGGLGDPTAESCVQRAVSAAAITVADGTYNVADLACDLVRGDEAPWRMSRDGYEVVDVDADHVRFHDQVFTTLPADHPTTPDQSTVLVIATETTPVAQIERAVTWLGDARPIVLAVARGSSSLEYAGAFVAAPGGVTFHLDASRVALRARGGQVTACFRGQALGVEASVTDPAAIDRLVSVVKSNCTLPACAPVIEVVPDPGQPLVQALGVITAIRAAGFESLIAEHPSAVPCQ